MCVKPFSSELENYFLSILKEPPSVCTQSTSVPHHHPLGYNTCHYLTARKQADPKGKKISTFWDTISLLSLSRSHNSTHFVRWS